jgi:hypothetical protein
VVETAEREARIRLQSAGEDVQEAIKTVLLSQADRHLMAVERAYAAVASDVLAVHALAKMLSYGKLLDAPHGSC